ncbi:MAG: type IV pilus assembly protein FimV, partial [Gammaproteobacteria bacterium]
MQTTHRFLTSLILAALPSLVQGVSLGALHSSTRDGEAIDAYIDLYVSPSERATPFEVALSHDFVSDPSGITRPTIQAIRGTVEHRPDGYSTIHLQGPVTSTKKPLVFRLRVEYNDRALSRHYSFIARPVTFSRTRAAIRTTTRNLQKLPTIVSRTSASDYGPVRSGENLWSIARRLGNGANTMDLVQAIHRANPDAFIHGDRDRLKLGVNLSIPRSTLTAAAIADAPPPASIAKPLIPREPSFIESTYSGSDPFEEGLNTTLAERPGQRNLELPARLAAMDAKFAAIRAKYQSVNTEPTEQIEVSMTRESPPSDAGAAAVVGPASPSAIVAGGLPLEPAITRTLTPAAAEPRNNGVTLATLFGILLLVGALLVVHRYRAVRRRAQDSATDSREADRRAIVAQKAEQRVRMESAIRHDIKPGTAQITQIPATDAKRTMPNGMQAAPLPMTETNIDSSIAHGRYAEAEHLLREAIVMTPRNTAAKLRLAEVYYITERVAEFNEIATDLQ